MLFGEWSRQKMHVKNTRHTQPALIFSCVKSERFSSPVLARLPNTILLYFDNDYRRVFWFKFETIEKLNRVVHSHKHNKNR